MTSETDLHLLFDMALKGSQDMARAQDPRLVLDVLLLRMLSAPRRRQIADLLASALPNTKTLSDTASPASAPPTVEKKKLLADEDLSPIEKWVKFINQVRQQDALFAAKLDNLLFLKEENFCLYFAVPQNLVFLKEQMKDSENRKKLQAYIDSQWGQGYAFEVIAPTVENKGESAQNLMVKKQADDKSKLQEAVENHPLVQKAKSVFNGEIKSIKKLSD
jgi:DNA polymerase-3 subunit gamma/tau